jgi:nucleoid-associated protein YgaU
VPATRVLFALGVVVAGLIAAWPFRQSPSPPAIEARSPIKPLQLTVRRPDQPLELAPRIDVSPAEGLRAEPTDRDQIPRPLAELSPVPIYALENLAPPPALPVSFQPSPPPQQPNDWRPDAALKPAVKPRPPRPYRIRDRDTLELIAERLLGDRQRAGEVFEANRNVLPRPDLLPVGVTILLPPRENRSNLEPVAVPR